MRIAWPIGFFVRGTVAGLAVVFALCLQLAPAQAQGSTGGSIGKQDKSVSGGQDGGVRSKPRSERPSRSERSPAKSRSGGGGGGNFDGRWNSASFGRTCSDKTTDVVTISGGQMSGTGFSGRVSGSGSVSGVWSGSGISANVSGRMSGNSGSGSFRRSDGCVGSWTLSRQ
jgi:hypothetical protein